MKLLSKRRQQNRSRYVLELSSTEFNFLRLCLNAVIDSAGIDEIARTTPYREHTVNRLRRQIEKASDAVAVSDVERPKEMRA